MGNVPPGFLLALLLFWPLQGRTAEAEEPSRLGNSGRARTSRWTAGGDRDMLTMTLYVYCGEEFGAPLAIDVLQWQGTLPCSDRYTIDVSRPHPQPMR